MPNAATPDDLAKLVAAAHTAARAGQVAEARAMIAEAEGEGCEADEVLCAIGMLHLLTGDAKSCARNLSRVRRHSKESAACLTVARQMTGGSVNPAGGRAIGDLIAETCVEDALAWPTHDFVAPQSASRSADPVLGLLKQGRFKSAAAAALCPLAGRRQNTALRLRSGRMLPLWRGEPGKRLAVVFDDGLGDCFLFGRYLSDLAAQATDVVAVVSAPVFSLIEQSAKGKFRVARFDQCADDLAGADAYADAFLLPHQTGAGYGTAAWLTSDRPEAKAQGFHVGIVWGGSVSNSHDALRSMRIEQLRPLLGLPNVTWHSLQVGPKAAECPAAVVDHSHDIRDFRDTANIIAGLDLVISIDSSVANLCGALGLPIWVMVERGGDFRWGIAGASTPWFPTGRVFRQGAAGWAGVVEDVRQALGELVN